MKAFDISGNVAQQIDRYVDQTMDQVVDMNGNTYSTVAMAKCVKEMSQEEEDAIAERNKSWEGLRTKADERKSRIFRTELSRLNIICPNCRTCGLQSSDGLLRCVLCAIRFETWLSVKEIVERMVQMMDKHSSSDCTDQYIQMDMFGGNLIIYCESCPFNEFIL